jgi:SNF2 family DNA or RNA helicase
VEDQATDRAHRIGQSQVVEVIKLVAKGTIEEKIILLQEDKKEMIQSILTGELKNSSLMGAMSREELMQLFDRD